jgi:hypothetical protein
MKFPTRLFPFLNRSPKQGDRKVPMPDPTPAPAPSAAPDVSAQLGALTDAMRQLAEAQKTLLEAVKPGKDAPPAASSPTPPDVTGDPASGLRPSAVPVDYSKLSPLQQITLGLRGAKGAD